MPENCMIGGTGFIASHLIEELKKIKLFCTDQKVAAWDRFLTYFMKEFDDHEINIRFNKIGHYEQQNILHIEILLEI